MNTHKPRNGDLYIDIGTLPYGVIQLYMMRCRCGRWNKLLMGEFSNLDACELFAASRYPDRAVWVPEELYPDVDINETDMW